MIVSVTVPTGAPPEYIVHNSVAGVWFALRVICSSTILFVFAALSHQINCVGNGTPAGNVSLNAPVAKPLPGPSSIKCMSCLRVSCWAGVMPPPPPAVVKSISVALALMVTEASELVSDLNWRSDATLAAKTPVPAPRLLAVFASADESIVISVAVAEMEMGPASTSYLNSRSVPTFADNTPSPVPRFDAVLASPDDSRLTVVAVLVIVTVPPVLVRPLN